MKGMLSKIAAGNGHAEESAYFDGWKAYENDPFHPLNNPSGVIQMGLAENQVYIHWYNIHIIYLRRIGQNYDFRRSSLNGLPLSQGLSKLFIYDPKMNPTQPDNSPKHKW